MQKIFLWCLTFCCACVYLYYKQIKMEKTNVEKMIKDTEILIAKLFIELVHCSKKEAKNIELQLQAAQIHKSILKSMSKN